MDDTQLAAIVDAIVRELQESGAVKPVASSSDLAPASVSTTLSPSSVVPIKPRASYTGGDLQIDLPDPATNESRNTPRVTNPKDAQGLRALMASTTARIGVG
ncbi:MAG TPA: hypothetical protein VN843_21300, partial [Anaerolineales bacterium]|nr:hypothetical protein [Anaerolineales bacterium]